MTLRRKTVLIGGVALLVGLSIAWTASQLIVTRGFRRVEDEGIRSDVQRAQKAIANELAQLKATDGDWAWWDDTYAFVRHRAPTYVRDNLADQAFATLGINLMVFVDASGRVVYSKAIDLASGRGIPVPESLLGQIRPGSTLLALPSLQSSVSGLVALPEEPLLVAATPILTSDYRGPPAGTLIVGRYLDAALVSMLATQTNLRVAVRPYDDRALPSDFRTARDTLGAGTAVDVLALSSKDVAGYAVMDDVAGKPGILVQVVTPRTVYGEGQRSLRYFLLALLLVGLGVGGVSLLVLHRSVLSRLGLLRAEVRRVGDSRSVTEPITVGGHDELADVADAMNTTLAALEEAEGELQQALVRERAATARLRELDEMKNTFLQAVSHDLRTPLTSILGMAVTLDGPEGRVSPEEQRELASRIAVNARKLDRLLGDLLDVDRLARGVVEPRRQPTDIGELIERVLREADIHGRTIEVDAEGVVASVDGPKVERIVENLLVNADRHTNPGGTVWVRASRLPDGLLLCVDDEGDGVPDDLKDAIFDPFQQGADAALEPRGSGIGLALVSGFAHLHRGRAWVQDRPGGGASFRVLLPEGAAGAEALDSPAA